MGLIWALLTASAAFALLFLAFYAVRPPSLAKTAVKTASVAGLALIAFLMRAPDLLVAALFLGAVGDLALSRDGDKAFIAGLVAFALSHLAYVALIWSIGAAMSANLLAWGVVVFAAGVLTVLFPRAGALRWPVAVYVGLIALMGASAFSLPANRWIAICAAGLFIISDTILGFDRFVWTRDSMVKRVAPYAIWTTYWLAQLGFLTAFALERLG